MLEYSENYCGPGLSLMYRKFQEKKFITIKKENEGLLRK